MKRIFATILLSAICLAAFAQSVAPFKEGDCAVYLGDSITDGGHYHSYVWLYYMTRFPYMKIEIVNAGIGGDTAKNMYERFNDDVIAHDPTVLMVTFGMNDTGYDEYVSAEGKKLGEERLKTTKENWDILEKKLTGIDGVRIVMIGGSPYDETSTMKGKIAKGKNALMQKVYGFQVDAAKRYGWEYMDFAAPLTAITLEQQKANPAFTLTANDRVHPDNAGHMIMAYEFLKAQGMAGKKVADIEIDGRKGEVKLSDNCAITHIKRRVDELSFDYLAKSLPYPMDTLSRGAGKVGQAKAAEFVPIIEDLNQEILKVTGLQGKYSLYIDDELMGTWQGEDFAKGLNMAQMEWAPQYRQALSVMYLNEWRYEIERNFRDFACMQYTFLRSSSLTNANNRKALETVNRRKEKEFWMEVLSDNYTKLADKEVRDAREAQMRLLIDKMYEINKPIPHRITIRKNIYE